MTLRHVGAQPSGHQVEHFDVDPVPQPRNDIRDDVGAQPTASEEVLSTALGGDWEFRGIRPPQRS